MAVQSKIQNPKSKMAKPPTLTPVEMHALAAIAKRAKDVRELLAVERDQAVDVTLRLVGSLHVAEDQTATVTQSVPARAFLAIVLGCLPVEARKPLLAKVRRKCAAYRDGGEAPVPADDLVELADEFGQAGSRPATQERNGNVSGEIDVQVLTRGRATPAVCRA